jgi:hypothetical protein
LGGGGLLAVGAEVDLVVVAPEVVADLNGFEAVAASAQVAVIGLLDLVHDGVLVVIVDLASVVALLLGPVLFLAHLVVAGGLVVLAAAVVGVLRPLIVIILVNRLVGLVIIIGAVGGSLVIGGGGLWAGRGLSGGPLLLFLDMWARFFGGLNRGNLVLFVG